MKAMEEWSMRMVQRRALSWREIRAHSARYACMTLFVPHISVRNLGYFFMITLCLVAIFPRMAISATFEEMLSGFGHCQFKDVYLDLITKKPIHSYFLERKLQPCEIKEGMAYFCVNERFHGLPVYMFMVPAGTFDTHAISIDLPIKKSRYLIRKKFGTEYRENRMSDIGEEPVLLPNPNDPRKSILMCNPRSE